MFVIALIYSLRLKSKSVTDAQIVVLLMKFPKKDIHEAEQKNNWVSTNPTDPILANLGLYF